MIYNIKKFTHICIVVLSIITAISFLGSYWWLFDLLSHARIQYLICAILGLITILILRTIKREAYENWYIALCTILILANAHPIASFYFDGNNITHPDESQSLLRVMSLNVLKENNQYNKTISKINNENPDILLLIEIDNKWLDQMSQIENNYPYKITAPSSDSYFGMAMYSKSKFIKQRIEAWGRHKIHYISASIEDSRKNTINIVGVHARPPLTRESAQDNYNQLEHLIQQASLNPEAVVVMGDFNHTPWSYRYNALVNKGPLYNVASGAIPYGTWFKQLLGGILIDHILVKNLSARDWHLGSDVGSDHAAVIVDLQTWDH